MSDELVFTIDKFRFRVPTDRFYNSDGLWAKDINGLIRIGISDFVQQRSGDVAFAEIKPIGTELRKGDEIAVIETIKVDVFFTSPISGKVAAINPAMEETPEQINLDPYGEGWLVEIEPSHWESEMPQLLSPQIYFQKMQKEAQEETNL